MRHSGRQPPRFSTRTAWDRSASELVEQERHLRLPGDLLDLTVTNPSACGFRFEALDILEPLGSAEALQYTPDPKGLASAREAIVEYYASHEAAIQAEQITLTASTSEAYSHLFRLLCDAGDEVLIAQPSYPLFTYLASLSDVSLRSYPLFYDHGWWIDFSELEHAITDRTRAIIVVHPNNPTGHVTTRAERKGLHEVCRRYGLSLIVDEVFLDYPHDEKARPETFARDNSGALTFVMNGLSKLAALPQMKVGWIVTLGEPEEQAEALARLEIIADTFLSISTPAQLALPAWLQTAQQTQRQILARIRENLGTLREGRIRWYDCEAGWSALLRLPRIYEGDSAFEALRELEILTHPAHFYGLNDSTCVVISLIVPSDQLRSAVMRMQEHHLHDR